jgi:hypothetical protein
MWHCGEDSTVKNIHGPANSGKTGFPKGSKFEMRANDLTSQKIPSLVARVVKKTPVFHGTQKFIPILTRAHH